VPRIVALVGRPNVGKSTLFNRLVGAQVAVVHETPGTTRDRLYGTVEWRGRTFTLVDTGGIGLDESGDLQKSISGQAEAAMREADVIVFLCDAREGPLPTDVEIAHQLRRSPKPVLLVANKADSPRDRMRSAEFFELGLSEPIAVSAIQGTGTGDLLDRVAEELPPTATEEEPTEDGIPIAIVGRPNVGKSSLLNAIVGDERSIVNAQAGTTRDAIDTPVMYQDRQLVLIDTAGIRRRGRIERGIETYSVLRAMRAIDRADVAILVLDADTGITAQDTHVAGFIHDAAKGCIIAVNKWDLATHTPDAAARHLEAVRRQLVFLDYAPVLYVSAKTGRNVSRLLDKVLEIAAERARRIPTAEVNEFMREVFAAHPLNDKGKVLKVFYATQASTHPPTFVIFVNDPGMVHFSYRRHIENQLRRRFGFEGTGLKLVFRGRSES
jgi:GTP-binding protein